MRNDNIGVLAAAATTALLFSPLDAAAHLACGDITGTCNDSVSFSVTSSGGDGMDVTNNDYTGTQVTASGSYGIFAVGSSNGFGTVVAVGPYAVSATSSTGVAVEADGWNYGIYETGSGSGAQGTASTGNGVMGVSSAGGAGIYGQSGVSSSLSNFGVAGRICGNTSSCMPGKGIAIFGDDNGSAGSYAGYFNGNVGITGALPLCSDIRLKKNVRSIQHPVDEVLKLRGVTFQWKQPQEHTGPGTHWGFIAQDVEKVHPQWVRTGADGFKSLNYDEVAPMLVAAVRELDGTSNELGKRLEAGQQTHATAGIDPTGRFGFVGLVCFGVATAISYRRSKRAATSNKLGGAR